MYIIYILIYIYSIYFIYHTSWFLWLWRPGSLTICWSARRKPENQESRWCSYSACMPEKGKRETVIKSLSLKAQRSGAPMSKGRKRWMSQLNQRKWICPSSTLLFCSIPQWIRWCLSALERGIFTHSTDSNANVFQRYFINIPRNNVYQLSGQKKHPKSRQWGHMEWDLFPRRDDRYS